MASPAAPRPALLAFGPHAGAHRVALRASTSVLVPLLVLHLAGHLEWSLYAAFGAFTSLYGRERVDLARLRLQATAGGWQVGSVTLGALVACSSHRAWLAVPAAAVVALLAAYASARQGWHPPGSLFQVFGVGAVATVPAGVGDIVPALTVSTACALFAMLVGNLGAVVRRVRRTAPLEQHRAIGGSTAGAWSYGVQAATGVLIAGAIANAFDIGRPYWAMVGAVVPLAARALPVRLVRGAHRLVGTGVGLLASWALLAISMPTLVALLLVALLQAAAELTVGRNYALALVFITPLALMMGQLVRPVPTGTLIAERALETLIGVVVGVAVGLAWWQVTRPRQS